MKKLNVILNANDYPEEGVIEHAEAKLKEGSNVTVQNIYYERDRQKFEDLSMQFSAKCLFSSDFTTCFIKLKNPHAPILK